MISIITTVCNSRFHKAITTAIVGAAFLFGSVPATAQTSGVGTAVIDGTMSAGEWDGAGTVNFDINLPEGGTASGTLLIMNDADNLYMALSFPRSVLDPGNSFVVEFDNDGSGGLSDGDDGFVVNPASAPQLSDNYRVLAPFTPTLPPNCTTGLCGFKDINDSGTNDGVGIGVNDGFNTIYEASKALDSADNTHDFSLIAGDTIGYFVFVRISNGSTADTNVPIQSLQIAETAASRILDFESQAHGGGFADAVSVPSPYHEDGFTITSVVSPGTPNFAVFGSADPRFTGSAALANGTIPATHTLTNDLNIPFTLVSIDISEYQIAGGLGFGTLHYTGIKTDTMMVMNDIDLDEMFGAQTFMFPAAFSDLVSVSVFIGGAGPEFHQIDNVVLQVQSNAIPDAMDDDADADCGVDTIIDVLANDEMLFDPGFVVVADSPTGEGGTTVVNNSGDDDPANISVTYTSADGFDGTDTFTYTVTDEDGTGQSSMATVTVEVDGSTCKIKPGDTTIFNPDPDRTKSDLPVKAAVKRVIKDGTAKQTSCVIEEDADRGDAEFDLVKKIKETQDCIDKGLVAELEPDDQATLKKHQRAFKDSDDGDKKKIVVTLIRFRNLAGEPDQLTKGVAVLEEDATKQDVKDPACSVNKVSDSPSTVGVNLSADEPNGEKTRNLAGTCNRLRSFGHFSDHLLFHPIRNDSSFLKPKAQVNQEAADFRDAVGVEQAAGCVDGRFLRDLHRDFNKAMRLVNKRNYDDGICALQDLTVFALDPEGDRSDPYPDSCENDPGGHLPSRLIALTHQIHRGLRSPDTFELFPIDLRILCRLPPFPGEVVPMCPGAGTPCP